MIIVLKQGANAADAEPILERIRSVGLKPLYLPGEEKIVIGALGDERVLASLNLDALTSVEKVIPVLKPYKLSNREFKDDTSVVRVGNVEFGGPQLVIIAGPCSVESEEQIVSTALAIKEAGAVMLRGGAFKPRTSPYAFQGLGEEGLHLLVRARTVSGLPVVTEVISEYHVDLLAGFVDMFQIGARNMQNFSLLQAVGETKIPVLLKRGAAASVTDLLMAAEYVMSKGNANVVLCERGIKSLFPDTRNTFDLSVIPLLHRETHLPVIADPSHATGDRALVPQMSLAAVAAGADGLIIEVHPNPAEALSDGFQQITPQTFASLVTRARAVAHAVGRSL